MVCNNVPVKEREYTGKHCTKEEIDSLKLILNKITCAKVALSPLNIPDDCPKEKAELFINAVLKSLSEAQWLEDDWWGDKLVKYKLPRQAFIDFERLEFYTRRQNKNHGTEG